MLFVREGIIALPLPPRPPFDIEKRRGIGGVLDGGEAGARRVSPQGGQANQTMEPLDVPDHWAWSDAMDLPPAEWWIGAEPAWHCLTTDLPRPKFPSGNLLRPGLKNRGELQNILAATGGTGSGGKKVRAAFPEGVRAWTPSTPGSARP